MPACPALGIPSYSDAMTVSAAFFDVDNTLMRGASMYHLARGMARHGFFTGKQIRNFARKQLKYLASGKEHAKDLKFVTDATMEFVAGRNVQEILAIGDEIIDDILLNKLWPGTLKMAQAHKAAGQEVWLVTASPHELAERLAQRVGLTGGLGTRAEARDGVYTGRLDGAPLHGEAKADAVRRLAAERNIDLASSVAYSDSSNDLPLLSVVGMAVPVNPDRILRRHARAQGWPIVEFRRSRFWVDSPSPANPTVAAGAGIAAGLAALALTRKRSK